MHSSIHQVQAICFCLILNDWIKYSFAQAYLDTGRWNFPPPTFAFLVSDATVLYAGQHLRDSHPRIVMPLTRYSYHPAAISAFEPDIKGCSILVDDGANFVLSRNSRQQIIKWIKNGGTLVATDETGMAMNMVCDHRLPRNYWK